MKKFRVAKLVVSQIGPFGDLELKFPEKPKEIGAKAEVQIFVGENGTGKTTILEILANCFKKNASTEIKSKGRTNSDSKATMFLHSNNAFFDDGEKCELMSEGVPYGNNENIRNYWRTINQGVDGIFSYAFFAYSGYRRVSSVQISGIQELSGHPLTNSLDFQATAEPLAILQWIANTIAAEAIARTQSEPLEADHRRQAISRLEQAIGDVIGQDVTFKLETKPFAVKIEVNGERLDFNLLPDGLKSIISWVADLLMRMDRIKWEKDTPVFERKFTLFLDEIEVHMHPSWQRKILPVVQNLFPNAQIFISTHSPFVVGSVDGAWIHKLIKPNGDSKLAEGFPVLSQDEKTYEYWLEEVFDIHTPYGWEAQKVMERRRTLLKKKEISEAESEELVDLEKSFDLFSSEKEPLKQRIIDHLNQLKASQPK